MKNFKDFLAVKNITQEQFDGFDVEKQSGLYIEYNEEVKKELDLALENKASKEDIDALRKQINDNIEKQMETLNGILKAQGVMLKRLSDKEIEQRKSSIDEALKANVERLKTLKQGMKGEAEKASFDFVITKAVGNMTSANISGGNVPVEDRIEGLNTIASRRVRFLDVLSRRATDSNLVSWVYQANKEGAAGQTAEGAAKNQIDFDLVVSSQALKKTTAFIKVSTEMLDDISWIRSEIENELMRELLKAVEAQAYSGDNTGQNLNGIYTQATAFAAGAFALAIDNANEVDVLTVAANQIAIAEQDAPNYIFMHPSDVTKLKMVKVSATDKRYVERLAMVAGNLSLDGIPIIPTTLVTVGTYLIGNFDLAILTEAAGGIRIEIGLDADDFTRNMRTILAEWRGLTLVKNNDRTAFVKGTFATDKAALETA